MEDATKYEIHKLVTSLAGFAVDFVFLIYLVVSGWTFRIRDFAQNASASSWTSILIYIAVFGVLAKIIQLPFTLYGGYFLEHHFGLSRQSFGSWVGDQLKGLAIGVPLGVVGVELAYFFFRYSPELWWLYAGSIFVLFFVLLVRLAPVLLLPLFYKFNRIESGEMQRVVDRLARKTQTSICGVFEWSLGEKTRKANAAVVGWGKTRRIIVSDTLLNNFSAEEIEVIMAHELCHHVKNHIWLQVALQAALTYVGFLLTQTFLGYFSSGHGFAGIADIANLPILILISMTLSMLVLPAVNFFSRNLETDADAYALDVTGDSLAFVSGMEKLARLNLANPSPHRIVEFMFYSHPSIEKRIRLAADRVNV